MPKEDST